MKILLLTDIHSWSDTNYPNKKWSNYINSFWAKLESSISLLKEISTSVDLVINLWDFIHEESLLKDTEQYNKSKSLLESLWKPVFHVSGNHDLVYMTRDILSEIWWTDKLYYFKDFGWYRHIILDGNRDGNMNGVIQYSQKYRFDASQINWLQQVLMKSTLPCIVYSHFPIDNQDVSDNYYWSHSQNPHERAFPIWYLEVRKILEESKKVLAVFNGHTHFRHQMKIGDILYVNVGAFAENNGEWRATGEYAIADISQSWIHVDFWSV